MTNLPKGWTYNEDAGTATDLVNQAWKWGFADNATAESWYKDVKTPNPYAGGYEEDPYISTKVAYEPPAAQQFSGLQRGASDLTSAGPRGQSQYGLHEYTDPNTGQKYMAVQAGNGGNGTWNQNLDGSLISSSSQGDRFTMPTQALGEYTDPERGKMYILPYDQSLLSGGIGDTPPIHNPSESALGGMINPFQDGSIANFALKAYGAYGGVGALGNFAGPTLAGWAGAAPTATGAVAAGGSAAGTGSTELQTLLSQGPQGYGSYGAGIQVAGDVGEAGLGSSAGIPGGFESEFGAGSALQSSIPAAGSGASLADALAAETGFGQQVANVQPGFDINNPGTWATGLSAADTALNTSATGTGMGSSVWDKILGGVGTVGSALAIGARAIGTGLANSFSNNPLGSLAATLGIGSALVGPGGLLASDKNSAVTPAAASAMADPFGKYRSMYADQLNALMTNPSLTMSTPGYQFGLGQGLQGINRVSAKAGQNFSGNTAIALNNYAQNYGLSSYDTQVNRLAGLAGATQNPSSAATAALAAQSQQTAQQQAAWSGLAQGIGGLGGSQKLPTAAPTTSPGMSYTDTIALLNAIRGTGSLPGTTSVAPTDLYNLQGFSA